MSTRECSRCGETCHGCDNQDEPHLCERCKEKVMTNMDRFSDMNALLAEASRQAISLGHPYVGTEHLLLAAIQSAGGVGLMTKLGVAPTEVVRKIKNLVQEGAPRSDSTVCYTPRSKAVFGFAIKEADHFGCHQVRLAHLLVGMIQEAEGVAGEVLRQLDVDAARVRYAAASDLETAESRKAGAPAARVQESAATPPCDHVTKFRDELRVLYGRNKDFVTLDGTLDAHCHVCSAVFKIPEDLMRPRYKGEKKPQVVVTRLKVVTSVNVPDFSNKDRVTLSHVAIQLDPSVSLWLVSAQDDIGEWKETYATEIEKDAFVRGFRAASAMHGVADPVVVEIQKP